MWILATVTSSVDFSGQQRRFLIGIGHPETPGEPRKGRAPLAEATTAAPVTPVTTAKKMGPGPPASAMPAGENIIGDSLC